MAGRYEAVRKSGERVQFWYPLTALILAESMPDEIQEVHRIGTDLPLMSLTGGKTQHDARVHDRLCYLV